MERKLLASKQHVWSIDSVPGTTPGPGRGRWCLCCRAGEEAGGGEGEGRELGTVDLWTSENRVQNLGVNTRDPTTYWL